MREENMSLEPVFASKIDYELKRAERYRIFLSLVVFNFGPVVDLAGNGKSKNEGERKKFIVDIRNLIRNGSREIDFISNSENNFRVGILMPETSRQGAEAAARRISDSIQKFCSGLFSDPDDFSVPIEISSFPDAADTRSIASYIDEFNGN